MEIAAHFGFQTIPTNECGQRSVAARTVFFMPHCPRTLYENALASNWSVDALSDIVVVGNRCVTRRPSLPTSAYVRQSSD